MAHAPAPLGGPPPTNGVLSAPSVRGVAGGNRKKQKRRAKQAARQLPDDQGPVPHAETARSGHVSQGQSSVQHASQYHHPAHPELDYDDAEYDDEDDDDDDDDQGQFDPRVEYYSDDVEDALSYEAATAGANGIYANQSLPQQLSKRKNKKKRRSTQPALPLPLPLPYSRDPTAMLTSAISQLPLPLPNTAQPHVMSPAAHRSLQRSAKHGGSIWNTSSQEERERIKEFWLSLSEEERKSLLKIEKEAVLRKMKEQQKHSCSCTVCGRKRTAIEEELEVLYDAYYDELETYANHQHAEPGQAVPPPQRHHHHHAHNHGHHHHQPHPHSHQHPHAHPSPRASAMPLPLNTANHQHRTSRVHEIMDDGEQELSEDEEEEYSDEEDDEDDDDELYSDDDEPEAESPRGIGQDFFNFGNSLTVKGGILTVADDLLKNDGKKFIEMMEQLAERRMQREQEAEYAAARPQHSPYPPSGHEPPLDDEYDEEEDDYDSQDDYDEEGDDDVSEMGGMTDDQRMEEGRRMFQIFAARMFEQRVLTAYREKVAAERQEMLLKEIQDDEKNQQQKEAKKALDNQKKKNKKAAEKQAKAEKKAKKEAEKEAQEAAARAAEEEKQADLRRKKEEQRRKKEAEKKAIEEERQRKEAEKSKRQQEERDRQLEADRKLREAKAQEKRQRDDARKKEKDDKDAKEKEARDKKTQEERGRREREVRTRTVDETKKESQMPQTPQIAKRPSQVAVPPALQPKQPASAISSPHVPVATPAIPKAPTPARLRQSSQQTSHASSPKEASNAPSKSTSPSSVPSQASATPKMILQNPQKQQQPTVQQPLLNSPLAQALPPPGMHPSQHSAGQPNGTQHVMAPHTIGQHNHGPQNATFGNMQPSFPGGYQGQFGPVHGMNQRQSVPMYSPQAPFGGQYRGFPPSNNPSQPPPGMNGLGVMPQGRGFPLDSPPGFPQHNAPVGVPNSAPGFGITRETIAAHTRQQSIPETAKPDAGSAAAPTQPISRPAPIQRPSSIRHGNSADVDDLSKHLGSSALLDDTDDPIYPASAENRRQSTAAGRAPSGSMGFSSPMFGSSLPGQSRMESFGNPHSSWNQPSMFGPPGINAAPSWGTKSPATNTWSTNAFGLGGSGSRGGVLAQPNRPLAIRLAVCNACRQLSASKPATANKYHPVDVLLRQMSLSASVDSPTPSLQEIEDICETEGDAQNGGGMLHVRHEGGAGGAAFSVLFEPPDAHGLAHSSGHRGLPPAQLGEIGSPVPGHSLPAIGSRFGSLGGVGASSGL